MRVQYNLIKREITTAEINSVPLAQIKEIYDVKVTHGGVFYAFRDSFLKGIKNIDLTPFMKECVSEYSCGDIGLSVKFIDDEYEDKIIVTYVIEDVDINDFSYNRVPAIVLEMVESVLNKIKDLIQFYFMFSIIEKAKKQETENDTKA